MVTDSTPPVLTGLNLPTRTIQLTDSAYPLINLGLTVSASDSTSGLRDFSVYWTSPDGKKLYVVYGGPLWNGSPIAGTVFNGTWRGETDGSAENTASLSRIGTRLDGDSQSGIYNLEFVRLEDFAGPSNGKIYRPDDLRAIGIDPGLLSFSVSRALITGDSTPPTIAITSNTPALNSGQTALLTFTLSETSTNFTASDVAVSGGTLSNFSGSGTSYTATFTPTASNTGIISVGSYVFTDLAGNANVDGSDANNRVSITVSPQYTLSAGASFYDEGETAVFSLTRTGGFVVGSPVSYTVSGVTAADLVTRSLSGAFVAGSSPPTVGLIHIYIEADRLTEGNETLTVSVGGVSASTTIRDTSTAQPSSVSVAAGGATKSYSVAFTQASVRSSDGGATWTVTTPSGVETLAAPDRLRFSDKTIALDFDRGEAGHKTVTMIGAAFGKGFINQYFGTGVSLFDSGQSMAQVAQLVVSTGLIESMVGSSNSAWVRHVYKNVTGANPDASTEAVYRTYLDNGTYTRAGLLELAAGVSALENQINLVGIRAEGIGYVPFI